MWKTKTFYYKSLEHLPTAKKRFNDFKEKNISKYQFVEIFVNNGYAWDYKPLIKM